MLLKLNKITIDLSHYIPSHPKCGRLHGHTYFIKKLKIDITNETMDKETGYCIDLGEIKAYFKENWDHILLVPTRHEHIWQKAKILVANECVLDIKSIENTSVEEIAMTIKRELATKFDLDEECVHFTIYEGDNQGVSI